MVLSPFSFLFRPGPIVITRVSALLASGGLEFEKTAVHKVQLFLAQRLVNVSQLVGVDVYVVVGDEAGDELAVEKVVTRIHGPQTPVSIGVAVGAAAKASA